MHTQLSHKSVANNFGICLACKVPPPYGKLWDLLRGLTPLWTSLGFGKTLDPLCKTLGFG